MKLDEFRQRLGPSLVFSLEDIDQSCPGFSYRQLNRWQQLGEIENLRRGHYRFTNQTLNDYLLFAIANKIYSPSYVSLESALGIYNLIPEGVFMTTSVGPRKTARFETPVGYFAYRQLNPKLFWGWQKVRFQKQQIRLARPEKAILDYLYFKPHLKTVADFEGMRIDQEEMDELVDRTRFQTYLRCYDNRELTKRAESFLAAYPEQCPT